MEVVWDDTVRDGTDVVAVDEVVVEVVVAEAIFFGGVMNMPRVGALAEDGGHVVEVGGGRVVAHVTSG